jgi:lipoprotein-releasing system permease protein
MRLIMQIAIRQLLDRRRQAVIIVIGVVLGVIVLLVTTSLFGGLLTSFTTKILDVTPHVTMKAESAAGNAADVLVSGRSGKPMAVEIIKNAEKEERTRVRNYMTLLRQIERGLRNRITAASPFLSTQALAAYGVRELTLPVTGVIPGREAAISDLSRYLLSGSVQRLEAARNGMLIGTKAAEQLGVKLGDRIRLVSLTGGVYNVQIVGVYQFGLEALDNASLVNLRLAQVLERALPSEASGIGFQVADIEDAHDVASSIESITGRKAETWDQTNSGFIAIFVFLRALFLVVVGFVIVICGFGVANILITSVLEKQRDIAVMKSFGITSRTITWVYIVQGIILALAGSLIGSILGAVAIQLVGTIPTAGTGGVAPIDSPTLQMEWNPWYFALAVVGTLVVSIIASGAPARSAAKLAPATILRGER